MRSHAEPRRFFLVAAGVVALAVLVVLGPLTEARLLAQSPAGQAATVPADRPAFDVVSVKANKSGGGFINLGNLGQSGSLYRATNVTLNILITVAYQLKPQQMSGLPGWASSEHFDIEARAADNPGIDQKRLMLQSLLADRFKLVAHHETQQRPIYALAVSKAGKTGPQLQPHADDTKCPDLSTAAVLPGPNGALPPAPCGSFRMLFSPQAMHMMGQKITIETLASSLSRQLERVVVDRTGLSGVFDVDLDFAPQGLPGGPLGADANAPDLSGSPSIFTAIQEQLGLKLEPTTGPLDVLIIDHVEEPSAN
jgi:uncharacterized protein (TIGR03435 family)